MLPCTEWQHMGMFGGTKRADELLFLSGNREIATDNLWAIRAIVVLALAPAFMNGIVTEAGLGPTFALILLALPVYWLAVRLASGATNASE